jgi:hypothetical protein
LFPFKETIGEGPHTSEKINSKGRLKTEVMPRREADVL